MPAESATFRFLFLLKREIDIEEGGVACVVDKLESKAEVLANHRILCPTGKLAPGVGRESSRVHACESLDYPCMKATSELPTHPCGKETHATGWKFRGGTAS